MDIGSDLPFDYAKEHDIIVMPFPLTMDGKEYIGTIYPDEEGYIERHEYYDRIRAGALVKTSQINAAKATMILEPVFAAGDDVLYIALSTGISGAINSVRIAGEELQEKYPERRLLRLDSLCASLGLALLVMMGVEKKEAGMEIDALYEYLEGMRQHIHHWVTVDDLQHLKRGGRISGGAALIGTVFNIKPIIVISQAGNLPAIDKVQGRKKAIKYLVDMMDKNVKRPIADPVLICHGDVQGEAEYLAEAVRKRFGVEAIVSTMYHIIGGHVGPGVIALFFVSDKPRPV